MIQANCRPGSRSRQFIFGILCWFVTGTQVGQAKTESPAWLAEAVAGKDDQYRHKAPALGLLDSVAVVYEANGLQHLTIRRAVLLRGTEELLPGGLASTVYNADTDKLTAVRAWIVSPDGKSTKAFGRQDFLEATAQYSHYYWNSQKVINFSRVSEVPSGGILAWEFQIESRSSMFDSAKVFQSDLPSLRRVFEVTPAAKAQLMWHASSASIPAPVAGVNPGSLRWELGRGAEAPRDLPPGFIPNPIRVSVRCLGIDNLADQLKDWAQFAGLAADVMNTRIQVDASVKHEAMALTADKVGRWEKIRAITEFVQHQVAYLSLTLDKDSLAGYRPHLPAEILQNRFGDCKDKACLVVALLAAIDERGWLVLVNSRNPRAILPDWPSATFNHAIVAIPSDGQVPVFWPLVDGGPLGKLVLFDATDSGTPLGVLPVQDQGGFGLIVSKQSSGLVPLPAEAPENNRLVRTLTGSVSNSGDIDLMLEETETGSAGARAQYLRYRTGKEQFTKLIEARVHAALPGATDLKWDGAWETRTSTSKLSCTMQAHHAVRIAGDMLLLSPRLLGGEARFAPWAKDVEGVVWLKPFSLAEELKLQLPQGCSPGKLPSDWQGKEPTTSAEIFYRIEGQYLIFSFHYEQKAGFASQREYEAIRVLNGKVDELQRRPIIVHRGS